MITLEQILESRDRRVQRQRSLLSLYNGKTLLCLTVMPPGPVKRSAMSLKIAAAAVEAVRSAFSPVFEELRDLETGYEGYFIVESDPLEVKKRAVELEETHPLGRLFDLDVIVDGPRPMGREELGLPSRTCIICGRPVRECMRERTHTTEELLEKYQSIICHSGLDPESLTTGIYV